MTCTILNGILVDEVTCTILNGILVDGVTCTILNGILVDGVTCTILNGILVDAVTCTILNGILVDGVLCMILNGILIDGVTCTILNGILVLSDQAWIRYTSMFLFLKTDYFYNCAFSTEATSAFIYSETIKKLSESNNFQIRKMALSSTLFIK